MFAARRLAIKGCKERLGRSITSNAAQRLAFPVSGSLAAHAEADAKVLRQLFDRPERHTAAHPNRQRSGLFQSDSLRSTAAFEQTAKQTALRCQLIISRILAAPQNGQREMQRVVRNVDRLSDLLCGIIDCAELVRNAHPDPKWIACADKVYNDLCGYMNELNTHKGLYDVLAQVVGDDSLRSQLDSEALAVANGFLSDFEKSGIHLPASQRAQFVRLSDELLLLGRDFLQYIANPPQQRLDESTSHQAEVNALMAKRATNEQAREMAYKNATSGTTEQVEILEAILSKRAEQAQLIGRDSFASMTLADKMAKNPENVVEFLSSLEKRNRPAAVRDLDKLRDLKQQRQGTRDFQLWDREYYVEQHIRDLYLKSQGVPISSFLSVGTVFAGLSRLFDRLYGITLRAAPADEGEIWHKDVCKMEVLQDGQQIGTIYADLYSRDRKPPSAAHYTVRCSRRTDDDDELGDFLYGQLDNGQRLTPEQGASMCATLDTRPVESPNRAGRYQLPIIVLLFDFTSPLSNAAPTCLSWEEASTLFHEMGHALHSMIGRTEYHNVSGTRCATDFVELPSILMEHFISDPQVVELIARHYETDAALPYHHLQSHLGVLKSLESLETHQQIMLAMLDQRYHSQGSRFDTSAIWYDLQRNVGLLSPVKDSRWQVNFTHLYGYGAVYYSYLFDRAIASKIWSQIFASQPLSREAGEKFKNDLLAYGGGRDPWQLLANVLQDDRLAAHDEKAMQIVGDWGLDEQKRQSI